MSLIKQIYFRPLAFLFILILDFGISQEYNWSANLRFRARTDKTSSVDWQKTFAAITETRSRLGLDILGEFASAKFILQDSRYLGNVENNPGVTATTASPFLHQAYFTFSNLKIPFFDYDFVKVGRFELALGNQRLIAKNNWNNIGRSFEGLLGKDSFLSGELLLMHLFINETMNESHDDQNDVVIDGIYWTKTIPLLEQNSVYDVYFLNFRNMDFLGSGNSLASYNNIGLRFNGQKDNFVLESELTLQNSSGTSSNNDVSASLFSFNLGYKPISTRFLNSVSLGLDRVSGDDSSTETAEGFSKEFGARHKHHGFYDYTYHQKYFGHGHDGLNEINAKANIDILKRTNLLVALHNFRSAVKDIYYGSEVNFIFKTKHNEEISSEIGSVFYFPDQGSEKTLPFFYLMITAGF
jgi:hypothetical protein